MTSIQALCDQALASFRAGRLPEAEQLCIQIRRAEPQNYIGCYLQGVTQFKRDERLAAKMSMEAAAAADPGAPEPWIYLGLLQERDAKDDLAFASYDRALSIAPRMVEAMVNRGNLFVRTGKPDRAIEDFDLALRLKPDFLPALMGRAAALRSMGRLTEALSCFERVLAIKPDFAEALNNHGNVLQDLGRFEEALASFDRSLKTSPSSAGFFNRGNVLRAMCRFDAALDSYDRALAIDPKNAAAQNNRGNVLLSLGRVNDAIASLRQAMAIEPGDPIFHSSLIFALNFDANASAAEKQSERAEWNRRHAQPFFARRRPCHSDRDKDRRLRVGYVSSHFHQKSASFAFAGVVLNHDRNQFEVVCYSDTTKEDDVTAQFRQRADLWRQTQGLTDERLADLIRADQIDILVDLVGHMSGQRLRVFARKPAPIQVTGWGEPTGTGLEAMDYLLADSFVVSDAEKKLLAERVICLPNFLGYWTPEPLPKTGPLPALARGYLQFGCFNRIEKITPSAIASWAAILRAMPDAKLLLKDRAFGDSAQQRRIAGAFMAKGISAGQLEFRGEVSRNAHFEAYNDIDIALDPFPHGGGMTTLDALSMGVPVVTWAGPTISSRLAGASLSALALTELIANDEGSYVDLAASLAGNLDRLSTLRGDLPQMVAHSEFGDCRRYAQTVERAYRGIWKEWCSQGSS